LKSVDLPALCRAHLAHLAQALLQLLHLLADHAAVQLDLLLARAARLAERAALAFQVSPPAHEARRQMLEARELDLQLAFVRASALREDIEDDVGAVVDLDGGVAFRERALEVAHLRGRQLLVEDHDVGVVQHERLLDLLDLAGTREGGGIGTIAAAADHLHDLGARALHEARGLLGPVFGLGCATDVEGYEDCAIALRIPAFAQAGPRPAAPELPWRSRVCKPSASRCS
jgi:hypothetical protein